MMLIRELVAMVLEFITGALGLEGIAIGATAAVTVGLYYLREVADIFVVVARWARMLSIVGFVLLVALTVGTATGALEIGGVGQLISQITEVIKG